MTRPSAQRAEVLDALRDHPERTRVVVEHLLHATRTVPLTLGHVHRLATDPAAVDLPSWADLTDLDKGAALLHLHKCEWDGQDYAEENYPARFFDHPALTVMWPREASRFAQELEDAAEALTPDEHKRLYDLVLHADRNR